VVEELPLGEQPPAQPGAVPLVVGRGGIVGHCSRR
jgi:hypothetical protein